MILRLLSKAHFYNILLLLVFHFSCVKTRSYNFKLVIITGSSGRSSSSLCRLIFELKTICKRFRSKLLIWCCWDYCAAHTFFVTYRNKGTKCSNFHLNKACYSYGFIRSLEGNIATIQCRERTVDKNVFRPCRTNQMPKRNSIGIFMLAIHKKPIEIGRCRFHEKKVRKDL